jgi:type II secretory pathway pseudopilin PulG
VSGQRIRRFRGERGATLILAIAFLVVIGGIGAAVVASVTSSINNRLTLDEARNREYAADAGIELAIAKVRALPLPGPSKAPCGDSTVPNPGVPPDHYNNTLNGINIRVDCINQPTFTSTLPSLEQKNVVFIACEADKNAPLTTRCGLAGTSIVIRAQVNFEGKSAGTVLNITRTWVQSWSVNR